MGRSILRHLRWMPREDDPLGGLFPQRHDVPLAQVLETVNNHCGMLRSFEHWQQTYVRQATSHPALLAGVMGLGCGIGIRKMARISSSVTESKLDHTLNWRFSLENIRAANDAVVKAMDGVELPNLYRQNRKNNCIPPATARSSRCAATACMPAGRLNTLTKDKGSAPIPSLMNVISCGIP